MRLLAPAGAQQHGEAVGVQVAQGADQLLQPTGVRHRELVVGRLCRAMAGNVKTCREMSDVEKCHKNVTSDIP